MKDIGGASYVLGNHGFMLSNSRQGIPSLKDIIAHQVYTCVQLLLLIISVLNCDTDSEDLDYQAQSCYIHNCA
jgi:hypothetical protein